MTLKRSISVSVLERLVGWFNDLHASLMGLQRRRHASLLTRADNGADLGYGETPDLRTRLDQTFGAQPPAASGGLIGKSMAEDAAWRELGTPAGRGASSGVHHLLHLPTALLLRVTCNRSEELGGDSGYWAFVVRLDGIEAGLPRRRPVELSADHLQPDWLATVPHDKIAANDWPAALAAGKDWLESVLSGDVPVEEGSLSMRTERGLREQLISLRREKTRKNAALRALRADMACGRALWCWRRLLRSKPMVADAAFHVHDGRE